MVGETGTKWGLSQQGPLQDFREGGCGNSRQKLRFLCGSCYILQNNSPPTPPHTRAGLEPQPVRVTTYLAVHRSHTERVMDPLGTGLSLRSWKWPREALLG